MRLWSILPLLLKLFHSLWTYPLGQGRKQPFSQWLICSLDGEARTEPKAPASHLPPCWNPHEVGVREASLGVQGNKGTVRSGWCKCQTQTLWDAAGHLTQDKTCGEARLNTYPPSMFLTRSTPPRWPAPAVSIVGAQNYTRHLIGRLSSLHQAVNPHHPLQYKDLQQLW